MKYKKSKLLLCCLLITSIIISNNVMMVSAAKKAMIKTTEITLTIGEQKQIEIGSKRKGAKYNFKSNDTTKVTVDKKGLVTAKEAGTADVVVSETIKKTTKKIASVKVTVKAKEAAATPTPTPAPTTNASKTLKDYVADTNYDVPNDFWNKKSNVNYGTIKDIEYNSTATKSNRKAKVLLPAGYDANDTKTKYPVMYMIHGIFCNETTLLNDKVDLVIGNAIASGVAEKMIVVFPNAVANETSSIPKGPDGKELGFSVEHYSAYNNFLNDFKDSLQPYINSNFNALTGRENTAICGFSMGGRVTLHLGFAMPDKFRYIGAFNPAPGIFDFSDYGVTDKGLFTKDTFTLPSQYMNDTLVEIFAGTNDGIVRQFPQTYHDALVANKVPHIWNKTNGGINNTGKGGHDGDVYKVGLYNFMRRIFHNKE